MAKYRKYGQKLAKELQQRTYLCNNYNMFLSLGQAVYSNEK